MKPKVAVNSFIEDMQFDKHHYEKITAFDRNVIAKNQGRVLRYLVFRQKMITKQWVRRYITEVDDPASRIKNLGRLALAMTLDKALQLFLTSAYANCLIFEDDVLLNPHHLPLATTNSHKYHNQQKYNKDNKNRVLQLFSEFLSLPTASWHVQYLGFCFECMETRPSQGLNKSILLPTTSELYTPAVFPLCTHAILFSRAAVFVIMNTYKPFVSNKGDWMLHVTACEHNLKVIRPHEPLFVQNVTKSTLGGSQLGNYNDKRPFAHWVQCESERKKCNGLQEKYRTRQSGHESGHNSSLHQNVSDRSTTSLSLSQTRLSYAPGIPFNYIL